MNSSSSCAIQIHEILEMSFKLPSIVEAGTDENWSHAISVGTEHLAVFFPKNLNTVQLRATVSPLENDHKVNFVPSKLQGAVLQ